MVRSSRQTEPGPLAQKELARHAKTAARSCGCRDQLIELPRESLSPIRKIPYMARGQTTYALHDTLAKDLGKRRFVAAQ
jgi:hypothetical protein